MFTEEFLRREYWEKGNSISSIARSAGVNANTVFRAFKKLGIPRRKRGEAISLSMKLGNKKHPTKGLIRDFQTKMKISDGVVRSWEKISEEEKQRRMAIAKKRWDEMSDENKKKFRDGAASAMKRSAKTGSKLEKFILKELMLKRFKVEFHKEDLLSNRKLQIDLFLPEINLIIEVDGPTHFLPIWGDEKLERHIISDNIKTGLLLSNGYRIIRVKNLSKYMSRYDQRKFIKSLLAVINSIIDGTLQERFIQIEVEE